MHPLVVLGTHAVQSYLALDLADPDPTDWTRSQLLAALSWRLAEGWQASILHSCLTTRNWMVT